jgi:hypothetical protein
MTSHSATPRLLLLTTLILALAGDLLLRVEPWGVNFTLFTFCIFAGLAFLSLRLHDPIPVEAWPIAGFGLLTSVCVSWRDSSSLAALNVLAAIAAIFLVTAQKHRGNLLRMTFIDHLHQSLLQVFHIVVGFGLLLLNDLRDGQGENMGQSTRRGRVWLGIALAIPALLLFGSLLTSADATFEYLITDVLKVEFWTLVGHAALIAFLSWTIGGWLRGRFIDTKSAISPALFPNRISLGGTEIAIVLGSLNLLFGTFVAIQISYFFGGHATILATPSLTYAEYARRGFFELIAVAALSLPMLIAGDWLLHSRSEAERRLFRALSIVMITFLAVMLASAMHRLSLYIEAYGLTTSRVHAAAVLIWIALALLLFCATVLRGRRFLLPFAMAVSGYVALIGLNAVNPDALVARVNLTRMANDGKFDPKYTFRLSADAVPEFLEAIPAMVSEQRSALADRLLQEYATSEQGQEFRTWNAARAKAAFLVHEREAELRGYVLPPPPREAGSN